MEEWRTYKLGELYEVHNGLSKSSQFFGSGFPFLSFPTVFKNYFLPEKLDSLVVSSEKEQRVFSIQRGDVFITRTSETAEELGMSSVALQSFPKATYNGFTKRLRPIHGEDIIYPEFIGYYLRSPKFREHFYALTSSMSTRASLANGDLLNIEVILPSIKEQKRIADLLRALDMKINNNNRINHNLEEQAQVLFKSYFVDFKPFKHGQFIDSELGQIPRDWKTIRFKSLAEIQKNTLNPQKSPQSLFTLYSLPAYDNNKEPETLCGEDILSNKTIIDGKLVLVSKLNPRIKRIWPISVTANNTLCSTEFIAYKAVEENLHPFVWCYLNSESYYERIMSEVNGATGSHQRFHAEKTMEYLIPYNHIAASVFSQNVSPILESIIKNEQENRVLKAKRDLLLPKLLLGKLDYSDLISYL